MDLLQYDGGLSSSIIGAAIEVHRVLGPGLLESAYEECLAYELSLREIPYKRQHLVPLVYKGLKLGDGYRLDLLVADKIVVELKCVEELLPIHEAQIITYLRLTGLRIGLLMNFNVPTLKSGIIRKVL